MKYAMKNKLIVCSLFFFVFKSRKIKKNMNFKVNRKVKLTTLKYATKNKLIICFKNSHCLIFCAEYEKCQKQINWNYEK